MSNRISVVLHTLTYGINIGLLGLVIHGSVAREPVAQAPFQVAPVAAVARSVEAPPTPLTAPVAESVRAAGQSAKAQPVVANRAVQKVQGRR